MKNKPRFIDYIVSMKNADRPYVYENAKTGKKYKEGNAKILRVIFQVMITLIPVAIYIVFFITNLNFIVLNKMYYIGIRIAVIMGIAYLFRYPFIIFDEIEEYEEVQKEGKRLIDAVPPIVFLLGMGYICFFIN